uniref:Fatty acid hydroxylase domain-containing protein n=1 Tax=viral metagenome TaxID=1070528 RepID=A0A6C0I445_9ZZZZ
MFEHFFFVIKQVFFVFSASVTSAYTVCCISNTPFYNPELTVNKLITSVAQSSLNLGVICGEAVLGALLYYPYMDNENHTLSTSLTNIAKYSLLIELFYYVYHRYLHVSKWYLIIHQQHHVNIHVYPLDTLQISILDSTGMMLTLILPMLFVNVNLLEHNLIMYIYLTGAILTHSKLLVSRHVIHHQKCKCNFCFLFPIFDYAFGTLET